MVVADDEKVARLPKWAQSELLYLRRRVKEMTVKLDGLSVAGESRLTSAVALGEKRLPDPLPGSVTMSDYEREFLLPAGMDIHYWLGNGRKFTVEFGGRSNGPALERGAPVVSVRASFGGIVVKPLASNSVELREERRDG